MVGLASIAKGISFEQRGVFCSSTGGGSGLIFGSLVGTDAGGRGIL